MAEYYVRSMYIAPKGKILIEADLSQAESWIVAFLANEPNMKRALMYGDIHTQTAGSALFNKKEEDNPWCQHDWEKDTRKCKLCGRVVDKSGRYVGKRYNHASAYRMGASRAAEVINKDSDKPPYVTVTIKESKEFQDSWHAYYNIKDWWREIERKLDYNRTITTTYGRTRTFFAQWGDDLFKEATAYEPQSTVADHFNGAIHPEIRVHGGLIQIYRQLIEPFNCGSPYCNHTSCHKIINQAHDSCILEVPEPNHTDIAVQAQRLLLRPLIINGEEFTIPVDLKRGERWGELEELKVS